MSSFSDLLRPITGPNPSGENTRYTGIYDQIREARREDPDLAQGIWKDERKAADWSAVARLCTYALLTKTKDLFIASWLTEAWLHQDGFRGLAEGLSLLRGLVDQFWATLYPRSEEDELDFRAGPLEWVGSRLDFAVKSAPLTPTGVDWFKLAERRPELFAECAEAIDRSTRSHYRERLHELDSCREALYQLNASCYIRFGELSPGFDGLRTSLETVQRTLLGWIAKMTEDPDERPVSEEAAPPTAGSPALCITTRHQVPLDMVHFTVTAPAAINPASTVLLTLWVHLESQRSTVMDRARQQYRTPSAAAILSFSKGPVRIARGVILTVRLEVSGACLEDSEDSVLWDGEIGCANFVVTFPADPQTQTLPGRATIYLNGIRVAKVEFIVEVGTASADRTVSTSETTRFRKAFASYASADRDEVLGRLQGIRKAAPYMEIFFDALALRSGQSWKDEIERLILASDVFYLFWSLNARKSVMVEQEWRTALLTRRRDFIDPVPLQPPEEAPPPPELASLHFNDWMLAFQRRKRRS